MKMSGDVIDDRELSASNTDDLVLSGSLIVYSLLNAMIFSFY